MVLRIVVTIIALAAAVAHRYWPWFGTRDHFEIIALIVAVLPWASAIFKSVDIPGVGKFELQELKRQVAKNEGRILTIKEEVRGAVQSLEQRTDAILQPVDVAASRQQGLRSPAEEFGSLGRQYVEIRLKTQPGKEKTAQMSRIFGQMLSVAVSVENFDVVKALASDDAGERLQAYAFLYSKPTFSYLERLVATVTSGLEPWPFGQYWAIRAVGRIVENVDPKTIPMSVKRELRDFCIQLPTDTDRHFELSKTVRVLGFDC
jgi:hypothetical protein